MVPCARHPGHVSGDGFHRLHELIPHASVLVVEVIGKVPTLHQRIRWLFAVNLLGQKLHNRVRLLEAYVTQRDDAQGWTLGVLLRSTLRVEPEHLRPPVKLRIPHLVFVPLPRGQPLERRDVDVPHRRRRAVVHELSSISDGVDAQVRGCRTARVARTVPHVRLRLLPRGPRHHHRRIARTKAKMDAFGVVRRSRAGCRRQREGQQDRQPGKRSAHPRRAATAEWNRPAASSWGESIF